MRGGIALLLASLLLSSIIAAGALGMFQLGKASSRAEVNETNQEAQDEADQASSIFDRCIVDGGVFDFATGKCRRR